MLDLVRLHTFTTVVVRGSFSEAARALHVSQPAVSRQIALLERQLGTSLLTRHRTGVRLTPPGRLLMDHATSIIDRLALAESQVRAMTGDRSGTVRLGSFFTALVHLSAAVTARVSDQPGLRITDDLVDRDTAYAKLGRGELDLAVIFAYDFAPGPPPEGITVHPLFDDRVRVLLPATHRLAAAEAIDPADLAEDTWLRPADGGAAELIERVLAHHRLDPPRLAAGQGDEPVELQALVAAGRGVTLTHELTIVLDPGGVSVRPLATDIGHRRIAVAHAAGPLSPAADLVLSTLHEIGADRSKR